MSRVEELIARAEVAEADRLMLHWRDIALTPPLLALQAERDALADALRSVVEEAKHNARPHDLARIARDALSRLTPKGGT